MLSFRNFWRPRARELSEFGIWKLLQLSGTRRIAQQQPEALALAVQRCAGCRGTTKCDQVLAAENYAGLEAFCPNIMYFRHLEAMKRHTPKTELLAVPTAKR